MKNVLFTLILLSGGISCAFGQFKLGTDLYSRYIWRGADYGNSPSIQPYLTYSNGGLSAGFWGAYAVSETTNPATGEKTTYSENDFWISYTLTSEKVGSFSVSMTDYYIPSAGIRFGFFKPQNGAGAAHTVEAGISYTGPESLPVSIGFFSNISNDPDNSSYVQVSFPFNINEATLTLIAGAAPKKSAYYGTEKGGIINIGISAAKAIAVTDKFLLPINVTYTNNPSFDISYLAVGISLTF